jgi:hypothetical protein
MESIKSTFNRFQTAVASKTAGQADTALLSVGFVVALVLLVVSSIYYSSLGVAGSVIAVAGAITLLALSQYKGKLGDKNTSLAMTVSFMFLLLGVVMSIVGTAMRSPSDEKKEEEAKKKLKSVMLGASDGPATFVIPSSAPGVAPAPVPAPAVTADQKKTGSVVVGALVTLMTIFVIWGMFKALY